MSDRNERAAGLHPEKNQTHGLGSFRIQLPFLLWTLFRFAVAVGLLLALVESPWFYARVRAPLQHFIAFSSAQFLSAVWKPCTSVNNTFATPFTSLTIVPSCDGVMVIVLYLAAVACLPGRKPLVYYAKAILGGIALFTLNWLRIPSLALVHYLRPSLFEPVHIYVWQGLLIFAMISLWLPFATRFIPPRVSHENR